MRPPDSWPRARFTLVVIAVTALAWAVATALGRDQWVEMWGGFIPARVAETVSGSLVPVWLTPLTATLIHGGHVGGREHAPSVRPRVFTNVEQEMQLCARSALGPLLRLVRVHGPRGAAAGFGAAREAG